MKASLLIALITATTISAALAQIEEPHPYPGLPPTELDPDSPAPEGPPPGNLTPFVQLNVEKQENGCHFLSGYALDPEGTPMTYEWTAVDMETGDVTLLGTQLAVMACLPSGVYTVSFKATDYEGGFEIDATSITVEDRRSAPDLKVKSVSPSVLWPPNGKLWPVQLAYEVSHDPQTKPEVRIIAVNCNQRLGQNEVIQAGPMELYLAARRTSRFGERVYEITIEALDEHGSKDQETITIRVPADSETNVPTYTARKMGLSKSGRREDSELSK